MSVVVPQDLKDLGFIAEGFGTPVDFETFLQNVIDEQEALLSDRIGADTFADTTVANQVKQAAKYLSAAELIQRRINRLTLNLDADTAGVMSQLRRSKLDYLDLADPVITKLVTSPGATESGGYAGSVNETDSAASTVVPAYPVNGAL
jgi:hypothetical protein